MAPQISIFESTLLLKKLWLFDKHLVLNCGYIFKQVNETNC